MTCSRMTLARKRLCGRLAGQVRRGQRVLPGRLGLQERPVLRERPGLRALPGLALQGQLVPLAHRARQALPEPLVEQERQGPQALGLPGRRGHRVLQARLVQRA